MPSPSRPSPLSPLVLTLTMAPRDWLYAAAKYTAGSIVIGVVGLGGLLYAFQTKLIYPAGLPSGELSRTPSTVVLLR